MPYLSRLLLNPVGRGVVRELQHPYEMHRTLMRSFAPRSREEIGSVLFRADLPKDTTPIKLYVQSDHEPDWTFLADWENYLVNCDSATTNPAVKPFKPEFSTGMHYRFRLRANPTVKKNGKRIGLVGQKAQVTWMLRKAEQHGFTLSSESLLARNEGYLRTGTLQKNEAQHMMTHLAVTYDGVLRVVDPLKFHDAWRNGIGPAKAFGFGLLSLAPA